MFSILKAVVVSLENVINSVRTKNIKLAVGERMPPNYFGYTNFVFGLNASEPSPSVCHLLPKNLFHSMSQAQPLLVLMALSAEPPNPITF